MFFGDRGVFGSVFFCDVVVFLFRFFDLVI